jgi:RluA family pseudouridine synthase
MLLRNQEGKIHEVIQKHLQGISKNKIKNLFTSCRVLLDQQICTNPFATVTKQNIVTVRPKIQHLSGQLTVLYEDRHLIAVEKPAGLLSVATTKELYQTAHRILKNWKKKPIYPVHRLDRDTSGVMIFAVSRQAKKKLKDLFAAHELKREYLAIAEGSLKEDGIWDAFLYEDFDLTMRVSANAKKGKRAVSHFQVIRSGQEYTSLRVRLQTGRKNQIRAQSAAAGHPLIGDKKYGSLKNPIKRLGLHAESLRFIHPIYHQEVSLFSPAPVEFNSFFRYHQKKRRYHEIASMSMG